MIRHKGCVVPHFLAAAPAVEGPTMLRVGGRRIPMTVYLEVNGERIGPLEQADAEGRILRGEVPPESLVWMEGWPEWRRVGEVYAAALSPLPTATPPPLPASGGVPGPGVDRAGLIAVVLCVGGLAITLPGAIPRLVGIFTQRHTERSPLEVPVLVAGALLLAVAVVFAARGLARSRRARPLSLSALLIAAPGFFLAMYSAVPLMGPGSRSVAFGPRISIPIPSTKPAPEESDSPADVESESLLKLVTKPITAGPNSRTERDYDAANLRFFSRNWVEAYKQAGHRDPRWDRDTLTMLDRWLVQKMRVPTNRAPADYSALATSVMAAHCDDPLVLYVCARAQKKPLDSLQLYEDAVKGLKQSPYKATVRLYATIGVARSKGDLGEVENQEALDRDAMKELEAALQDGSFLEGDDAQIVAILSDNGWAAPLAQRNTEAVARLLEAQPRVGRWVVDLFWGRHHLAEAWRRRGSGFAGSVTDEGWRGFRSELEKAESSFTRSWIARPDQPYAAADMMSVMLGLKGEAEIRDWFDRAVAAQIDYHPAYAHMLWSLYPRWNGSHAAMMAFGRTALATGRFDTDVPWVFREAARDVEADSRSGGASPTFRWRQLAPDFKRLYAGYAAEPTSAFRLREWRSGLVAACFMMGDYTGARENLELLEGKPDEQYLMGWGFDFSLMREAIAAGCSKAGDQVRKAETAWEQRRTAEALAGYRALRTGAADAGPEALEFFEHRIASLTTESRLEAGGWVDVLARPGWPGWVRRSGDWTHPDGGGVGVVCRGEEGFAGSTIRVGRRWEARGQIEFHDLSSGESTALITCGVLNPQERAWVAVRLQHTPEKGDVVAYAVRGEPTRLTRRATLQATNVLHLRFDNGTVSLRVNDQQVLDGARLDRSPVTLQEDATLGLAAHSARRELPVVFRRLEVRQLR